MRPLRSPRCAELVLAVVLCGEALGACPCGAPAGAFPPWTMPSERFAVVAVTGWSRELGSYDANARARGQPTGVAFDRVGLDLVAAWRVRPAVELALGLGAQWSRTIQPGLFDERISLGDMSFRARWEQAGGRVGPIPVLALWGGLRVPTGERDARFGGLASAGLGHWEASLGVEARWTLARQWSLVLGAESGLRAPATPGNTTVTPGPRLASTLVALWRAHARVTLSLGASAWVEAGAWIDGAQARDTTMWRVGPVAGVTLQPHRALRVTASAQVDPLASGFGANLPAALRVGLGLGWVVPAD